eukprot:5055498-Prymnesium_polylepis.1
MHTDAGYGDALMGARRARSDASISRLVLVTAERVGRRAPRAAWAVQAASQAVFSERRKKIFLRKT